MPVVANELTDNLASPMQPTWLVGVDERGFSLRQPCFSYGEAWRQAEEWRRKGYPAYITQLRSRDASNT